MRICKTISELQTILINCRQESLSIGFVPTMGALHAGHLDLVEKSIENNDVTVVSIFVNPTQFNDQKDFEKYPRDISSDIQKLEKVGCGVVFIPEVGEIYPDDFNIKYDLGGFENLMEGKFRPGHFQGVAQIVVRLFEILNPTRAYFGEKDFQQLSIIQYLVQSLDLNIEIVPCPIVREESGLAMSSRNERLTRAQRENAALIYKTLIESREKSNNLQKEELLEYVKQKINSNPYLELEYFEIVDRKTLQPVEKFYEKEVVACIAVFAGDVRLIDNVRYNF